MKRWYLVAPIVFYQLFAVSAWGWEGTVVKVLDGDSLQVRQGGRLVELRLYGVDAPEYRQAYSSRAREFTRELLDCRTVTVEEKDVDRYGRTVALVSCQGSLVNRELVRAGLAWRYAKYCRTEPLCSELATLEQEARRARRGLWADPEPVPPWVWRHQKRSGSASGPDWYRRLLDWW